MRVILCLVLIVSSYAYAQSGHDHQSESQKKLPSRVICKVMVMAIMVWAV